MGMVLRDVWVFYHMLYVMYSPVWGCRRRGMMRAVGAQKQPGRPGMSCSDVELSWISTSSGRLISYKPVTSLDTHLVTCPTWSWSLMFFVK